MNKPELYRHVLETYGQQSQVIMAIEELSECAAKLAKVANGRIGLWDSEVLSEIADAEIMLEQLRLIIGDHLIDTAKVGKLCRLRERLQREEP